MRPHVHNRPVIICPVPTCRLVTAIDIADTVPEKISILLLVLVHVYSSVYSGGSRPIRCRWRVLREIDILLKVRIRPFGLWGKSESVLFGDQ